MNVIFNDFVQQWSQAINRVPTAAAAWQTVRDAADEIVDKGRASIAGAGFSRRFQTGLHARVTPAQGPSLEAAAVISHRMGFSTLFETGGQISGKRGLLWLPLPTIPDKIGGARMTPKNFVRLIGPLHTIKAPGKPPLLGAFLLGAAASVITVAKLRAGTAAARTRSQSSRRPISVPVFVGVSSVTILRHWHLREIYAQAEQNMAANFSRHFEEARDAL